MKFLHCADLHIGACSYLVDSLERSEKVIHNIFDIAKEHDIKTIVIAGDVFHEGNTTKEQRHLVQRLILGYDAAGFNILVIPGNHDLINHSGETALRYLAILYDMNRFKNSVVTEHTMYHQIDDTLFLLLVHKPRQFKKDLTEALNNLYNTSISLTFKNIVVVAHELIKGAMSEFKDKKGNNIILNKGDSLESDPLITYFALGDIHQMQQMGPRAFYSGSPYQLKFGEHPEKGILIVDTDTPDKPKFIPTHSKQLVTVYSKNDINETNKDHYITLVTNKLDLGEDLPENVVKMKYRKDDIDLSIHIEEGEELKNTVVKNVEEYFEKNKEKYKENISKLKQLASCEIDELFLNIE